jgi:hypothetical protein
LVCLEFRLHRGSSHGIFPNFRNYLKDLVARVFQIGRPEMGTIASNSQACRYGICYAEVNMIEFSQPAQCLFCPQRRKIALLLKLVMAGSAAVITAIILFQPGPRQASTPRGTPSSQSVGAGNPSVQVMAEERTAERTGTSEAASKRSAEIRAKAQERFEEVQAQIRPLLSEEVPLLAKAQKLLDERHNELLKVKVLTLGEGLFSGSVAAEAERKVVVEALDRELSLLAEQKKLLAELKGSN